MGANDLSKTEVSTLVYSYKEDDGVTDELYRFGTMMLSEVQDRSARLDSKAGTILGWGTGILAFLFVEISKTPEAIKLYFTFGSGLSALLAVIFAFLGLRTRGSWKSASDRAWIKETALCDADELKRYHIRVIHDIRHWRLRITQRKSSQLFWGEIFLSLAAALLFCGILQVLLAKVCPLVTFSK